MPLYEYLCWQGHLTVRFTSVANHSPIESCETCGDMANQIIGAPSAVKVAEDVHYESPIDGTPITSWAARANDLSRHNCVPYDPGMRDDHERRLEEADRRLEQAVDEHVERAITKMSTKQRGQLYSELTEQGKGIEYARGTR
jgi:hypothetical protein